MKKEPNEPKDGGAAFPNEYYLGMSLRDYFAAKVMQSVCDLKNSGFIVKQAKSEGMSSNLLIARVSYEIADAMLQARKESNGTQA